MKAFAISTETPGGSEKVAETSFTNTTIIPNPYQYAT